MARFWFHSTTRSVIALFSPISGSIACKDRTIKLLDYRARYYDPYLNRFISPDTIVPDPANPKSLNRYSYVYNNPCRYTDPSGHCGADSTGAYYADEYLTGQCVRTRDTLEEQYGFEIKGAWTYSEMLLLARSLADHVLKESWSTALGITIDRQPVKYDINGQPLTNVAGNSESYQYSDGRLTHTYTVYIYDGAWEQDPGFRFPSVQSAPKNFAGTISHELTHVALWENPELLFQFKEKFDQCDPYCDYYDLQRPACSKPPIPMGRYYAWDGIAPGGDGYYSEMAAMSVAMHMHAHFPAYWYVESGTLYSPESAVVPHPLYQWWTD